MYPRVYFCLFLDVCSVPLIGMSVFMPVGFPNGLASKESACSAGDTSSTYGSGRSPGEGNGNPLKYSCLKNPMDRGAWQATAQSVAESDMTE